ncbi:MAG: FAD-linked oxidase C-terminal domain-containing protein, partial [Gammaproteobacteria bacterium]
MLGAIRQYRGWIVCTHGPCCFHARGNHWCQQELDVFLGIAEGLLAVITEITVKLLPVPEAANVILAAFDDVATAGQAVSNVIADGILPAGLELMDNAAIRAADDFVNAGYDFDRHYEQMKAIAPPEAIAVTCYNAVYPNISPP